MPASGQNTPDGTCPINHSAREEWLKAAEHKRTSKQDHGSVKSVESCGEISKSNRGWIPHLSLWSPVRRRTENSDSPSQQAQQLQDQSASNLGTDRTVSSIPRATNPNTSATCSVKHLSDGTYTGSSNSCPSPNAETDSPETSQSGNWVYPSEAQFFSALRKKGHAANAADMSMVVPIHNAVNERVWAQILDWESPYPAPCGGPRLHSFSGDSNKLTPKARILTLLGYQRPFDRHDWTVDRCGIRVDYVIDFYTGRGREDRINFYLDVRPKLNSLEGVKMRIFRGIGIVP